MNISADEFFSLSSEMSDRDVKLAEMEQKLLEMQQLLSIKQTEIVALYNKLSEMERVRDRAEMENTYLKRYLWLSWTKVENFLSHISDIRLLAFIQTFMLKTVSEEMGPKALEAINEVVQLPNDEEKSSTQIQAEQVIMTNNGTVNAPAQRETATKTDKQVKQAMEMLMEAQDDDGGYLMQDQDQWYGVKTVLTQLCGFPLKPAEFEKTLQNLELNRLRVPYVYDSVRKVHAQHLPKKVELWKQYLNIADEYSHKQVVVAVRLMDLLDKVKP